MIKERNLNKFELDDYIEIQRLFIENEIKCYKECRSKEKAIIDLGPEEIEFYTINFSKSINKEWDIETLLHAELNELRMCKLDGIVFLCSDVETLRSRKENDGTRSRNFFDYYIENLHQRKLDWFRKKENVVFIDVSSLSEDEVFNKVNAYIEELSDKKDIQKTQYNNI